MPRLIEVQPTRQDLSAGLTVGPGDVLSFQATGGRVLTGDAVEHVGAFTRGVVGPGGEIVSPLGPPVTVLFRVVGPGRASLEVMTGDPWRSPVVHAVPVRVLPPGAVPHAIDVDKDRS